MNKKLLVPDIGDFEKVEVIEILVKKGDKVSIIESDAENPPGTNGNNDYLDDFE